MVCGAIEEDDDDDDFKTCNVYDGSTGE